MSPGLNSKGEQVFPKTKRLKLKVTKGNVAGMTNKYGLLTLRKPKLYFFSTEGGGEGEGEELLGRRKGGPPPSSAGCRGGEGGRVGGYRGRGSVSENHRMGGAGVENGGVLRLHSPQISEFPCGF